MTARRVMTRADWDTLYRSQRVPCSALDDDDASSHCAQRAGHPGDHSTGARPFARRVILARAVGAPGYVVRCDDATASDPVRSILVATDWDYPGIAGAFGWSLRDVVGARVSFDCADCDATLSGAPGIVAKCPECDAWDDAPYCDHDATDGAIDCAGCGATASDFIASAGDYLSDHIGAYATDPGYFTRES